MSKDAEPVDHTERHDREQAEDFKRLAGEVWE